MKNRYFIITLLLALVFSSIYWVTDSVLQYHRFDENLRYMLFNEPLSVAESIFVKIPPHHILTRIIFICFCFIGAGLVMLFIKRWKESESRFQAYIESAPNAIFAFDDTGKLLDFNRAMEELLETGPARLKGLSLSDLSIDEDFLQRALEKDFSSGEVSFLRQDGSSVPVLLTTRRISSSTRMGIATDVSDLNRAKDDVQHLNRVLMAIRRINQTIYSENDPLKIISLACSSFTDDLGYARAWIILTDRSGRRVLHAESGCPDAMAKIISAGLPKCAVECLESDHILIIPDSRACDMCPLRKKDCKLTSMCINLKWGRRIYGVMSVAMQSAVDIMDQEVRLITELADDISHALHGIEEEKSRVRAEEALVQSEEKYRMIAENTLDCITILNEDLVFTYINAAVHDVLGYTTTEWIGTELIAHVPAEHFQAIASALMEARESGQGIRAEMEVYHKDGHPVPMDITARAILDERTGKYFYQGVARDLTQKYLAEEQQKLIEAQLRQSQKMEAVGQLAGGLAHDFNNILQSITGFGEIALYETEDGSPIREHITEILKGAERATSLTRQLLAFSRKQVLQKKILDLNSLVTNIMKLIRRAIGEHIELTVNSSADYPIVNADPSQLEQVLLNLCVNARDAMPDGGKLTITTGFLEVDGEKKAMISVKDSGEGMDRETVERIFEPFFTTKPPGSGTGLGLSTVIGIINQHDGTITVSSAPGRGSEFVICLPTAGELKSMPGDEIVPERMALVGGDETILLVEDDETIRRLTCRILSEVGYTVLEAEDGSQAINSFRKNLDDIALVLSDILMPVMGGKELYHKLQEFRQVEFLFMSGYSSGTLSRELLNLENVEFIRKPFSAGNLLKKVREILDGSSQETADAGE